MATIIIGGQTNDFIELYHYDSTILNSISKGKFWTTYKTDSSSDAKRMTGSTNYLNYRITAKVNHKLVYDYFIDAGTKWGPQGYGAALEYKNRNDITREFITINKIH